MNKNLLQRIYWSKGLGLCFGLMAFVLLPYMWPDVTVYMRWGVFLWHLIIGGIIGVVGFIAESPMGHIQAPAVFRGMLMGGVFMLAFVLVSYDLLLTYMASATIFQDASPYWIILDGVFMGGLIDWVVTKKFGEGQDLC